MKLHITRLSPPNEFDQVIYGTYCLVLDSDSKVKEVYLQSSKDDDHPEWIVIDDNKFTYKDGILIVFDKP